MLSAIAISISTRLARPNTTREMISITPAASNVSRLVAGKCVVLGRRRAQNNRNGTLKFLQVPTRRGAASLRSVARTESATILPVLGLSDGTFSIESVNDAESASTSIVWQLRV